MLDAAVSSKPSRTLHSNYHHYKTSSEWTNTFFQAYQATGMFGINFAGDAKYVSSGIEGFIGQLKAIAGGSCSAENLKSAKTKVYQKYPFLKKLWSDNNYLCE